MIHIFPCFWQPNVCSAVQQAAAQAQAAAVAAAAQQQVAAAQAAAANGVDTKGTFIIFYSIDYSMT